MPIRGPVRSVPLSKKPLFSFSCLKSMMGGIEAKKELSLTQSYGARSTPTVNWQWSHLCNPIAKQECWYWTTKTQKLLMTLIFFFTSSATIFKSSHFLQCLCMANKLWFRSGYSPTSTPLLWTSLHEGCTTSCIGIECQLWTHIGRCRIVWYGCKK